MTLKQMQPLDVPPPCRLKTFSHLQMNLFFVKVLEVLLPCLFAYAIHFVVAMLPRIAAMLTATHPSASISSPHLTSVP
jgi:hypothetical protein